MASYIKAMQPETPTVELTVPLFIRLLELVREEVKTDINLHKILEVILALADRDEPLSMDDYRKIADANP
jgi:hypothetical protein